jgi:hypothetical protein
VETVKSEQFAARSLEELPSMGIIRVHEFTGLDGIIDTPTWTFDFGYDPAMGRDIGNLMSSCDAILLGRNGLWRDKQRRHGR